MAKKVKAIRTDDKVSLHQSKSEPYCSQWKEDILIEFGHMTKVKEHSYMNLNEINKTDTSAILKLLDLLTKMSDASWDELSRRSKYNIGGFESFEASLMKRKIWDRYYPDMPIDTKLYIFRFGNEDKYRMVGYKSKNCSRVLHILGFDLDYSLYDHGK